MIAAMPDLSVIVVVGEERVRAQRALDALARQTALERLEVVVVDHASAAPSLRLPAGIEAHVAHGPELRSFGHARLAGARAARAPIVAYIEDHVYAEPDWAERLLDAYARSPDAVAIGYGFVNAHPESYVATATLLAEYGPYVVPVRSGPTEALPGSNVSYRRRDVLEVAEPAGALAVDWVLRNDLLARGRLLIASDAIVRHESLATVRDVLRATYVYGRTLAAARARHAGWSRRRRWLYAAGAVPVVPVLRAGRFARSLRGRRPLWRSAAETAPILLATWLSGSIGEAVGYSSPIDGDGRELLRWETGISRRTT
jgi:hypothetical protein